STAATALTNSTTPTQNRLLRPPRSPPTVPPLPPPTPSSTLFPYTTLFRSHLNNEGSITDLAQLHRPDDLELYPYALGRGAVELRDRKSTRLNSSHVSMSYAVFCLKKKRYRQGIAEGES